MKNYWKRLLIKVITVLVTVIVVLYTFEQLYPNRVDWKALFTLTNTLVDAWGNLVLMLIILAYLSYTRTVVMKSLGPHLKDLKQQTKDITATVIASIEKINATMDTLENTLEISRDFITSGEWRKELENASNHLQKQLEELAKSAELKEDAIELKNAIIDSLGKVDKAMDKLSESTEDLKVYLRNNPKNKE